MNEEREDSFKHVLKYTGVFGGVQGLSILISLVRNKIIALLLGPGGMGLMSLFNSTVNFISQSTNFGISFSAVRNVSELFDAGDEAQIRHFIKVIRGWCLLTALLGMLVCVAAGPFLSNITFAWGNHTLHFVMLAPAVGIMAISGGETAILKGARQLKSHAVIQIVTIFAALLISVPLFYFFRQAAIVPVIVLMALVSMLLTIYYSYRLYPLELHGLKGIFGEGMSMVRLGIAFVIAGILGSGAEIVVRSYLNVKADLDAVGLYNACFMLVVTYAGMVFSAMETDYFPRLSAVGDKHAHMCDVVNRQVEVSLLVISPMLSLFIAVMPVIIPLLFTKEFNPVVSMAQVAALSMYLKAVSLPMAYLQLAKGNSKGYLLLESIYDVALVLFVILGYFFFGLWGTGLAITIANLLDVAIVYGYVHVKYRFRWNSAVVRLMLLQFSLGLLAYLVTLLPLQPLRFALGIVVFAVSLTVSLRLMLVRSELHLNWKELPQLLKKYLMRNKKSKN